MKRTLIIYLLILISMRLFAGSLDSLLTTFNPNVKNEEQVNTLFKIAREYKTSDKRLYLVYNEKALQMATEIGFKKGISESYFNYATHFRNLQKNDSAIYFYKNSLKTSYQIKDTSEICKILTHLGNLYFNIGNFNNAIKFHEISYKISAITQNLLKNNSINDSLEVEKIKDFTLKQGKSLFNIGNAYKSMGILKKALDYHVKAKEIFESSKYFEGISNSLNMLGILYTDWNDYDKAMKVYQEAETLILKEKIDNPLVLLDIKNNIGKTYVKLENYPKAIESYNEAGFIAKSINNPNKYAYCLTQVALAYTEINDYENANIYLSKIDSLLPQVSQQDIVAQIYQALGYSYMTQNKCNISSQYLIKSIEISKQMEFDDILSMNYLFLSQAYMCLGDGKKSLFNYKLYEKFKEETNKRLNDSRIEFETAQQNKEIDLLNKQQEINNELIIVKNNETKQQRFIIYIFIVGLIIIAFFLIVFIRQYRQKKKANIIITEKNHLLEHANLEITSQRDEIEKQRDTVIHQKKEIEDSINYAQRIQSAVLTLNDTSGFFKNRHFIIFKPKSIVSGDFYWAAEINNQIVFTVADSTGHGVPGAFMSMLGVSFLSEIVHKKENLNAGEILNDLRKHIIDALKQQGKIGEQKDGMDITLCVLNKLTFECQFAGANNQLLVYKKSLNSLIEYKADKMPVAIYERMDLFNNYTFQLEKGDRLYLFSDGFADQFGGPKGRKFMYKNLKELILNSSSKLLNNQYETMDNELILWMNYIDNTTHKPFEQVDDITLMGVEI